MKPDLQIPALKRQDCFQPPYCPNENCVFHLETGRPALQKNQRFYHSNGWARIQCFPHFAKRFRCKVCGQNFRYSTFKLEFRERIRGLNSKIFNLCGVGLSNREIGRQLEVSEHYIRQHLLKLSQWAFIEHAYLTRDLKIDEEIAYDGLENFAGSQYDPTQIQHAVGAKSLFIYLFNEIPLNRKGRMSDRQKVIRDEKDGLLGRYPPNAIRLGTRSLIQQLYEMRKDLSKPLILLTDEHFQYRRVIQKDLKGCQIEHHTVSSKDTRNFQNILFPVNHVDLLIRHHIGAFKRETICFSKTRARMIHKYMLYLVMKNYFRPQFVKAHVTRPEAHLCSPAMVLGLTSHVLEFHEFFSVKRTLKQVPLSPEWNAYYHDQTLFNRSLAP